MPRNVLITFLALTLLAVVASGATFVVPTDRELIHRTDAIVIGNALVSYSQLNDRGGIDTVTSISVEEVIKGSGISGTINVVEPGGVVGNHASILSGVPKFTEGQRMLLFLKQTGKERWAATELVLGKFTFTNEGEDTLLLRDEGEISGWDPDLKQHREPRRSAAPFLQFVRDEAGGRMPRANYTVDAAPSISTSSSSPFVAAPNFVATALAFSANSYTMIMSGTAGGRWSVFPTPSHGSWARRRSPARRAAAPPRFRRRSRPGTTMPARM